MCDVKAAFLGTHMTQPDGLDRCDMDGVLP